MMLRRASRLVLEAAALAAGLVASVGLTDALRGVPGPSLALALPLRETGHDDRASLLVVVGCSALLFGLAARALGGERPQPARGALVRAAVVLAGALTLQAVSLELVRQATLGFDWEAALRSPAPYASARRRAARNRGGRQGSVIRSADTARPEGASGRGPIGCSVACEDRAMSTHTADRAPMLRLGPTRAIARRASAVRAAIALAVALFGFVQVIAVENGAAGTIVGRGPRGTGGTAGSRPPQGPAGRDRARARLARAGR